jgi:hypothetical protein
MIGAIGRALKNFWNELAEPPIPRLTMEEKLALLNAEALVAGPPAGVSAEDRERIAAAFHRRHGFGRCPVKILLGQGALVCSVCEGQPIVGLVGDFPVCGDAGCFASAMRRTYGCAGSH